MEKLSVEQKELIQRIRREVPALANFCDEDILTIYNQNLDNIKLSEDEQISVMGFNSETETYTYTPTLQEETDIKNNKAFADLVKIFSAIGITALTFLITRKIRTPKKITPNYWVKNKPFSPDDIDKTGKQVITHYKKHEKRIRKHINAYNFEELGEFSYRIKSDSSLRDKIKNYIKKHPNATHRDIWDELRDCFGFRTVIEPTDYTKHPEVKKLIDAGDIKGAMTRAAELQSQPAVDKIKQIILANAKGDNTLTISRITNYVSKDGIPYFSEKQLAELKDLGVKYGVEIDYVRKALPDDPKVTEMVDDIIPTTKSQPSGYTALQMNFVTKDGDTIEWQFRSKLVDRFAEGEHIPYDLRTGKDITGGNPNLEAFYDKFKTMLLGIKKDTYKAYNKYLDAHYEHLRKLELGFESTPPKLQDFAPEGIIFSNKLEAENLIKISDIAHKLKKGEISLEVALKQYDNI